MPVLFYYKNLVIKFWSAEESRPHVQALSDVCQVKFWLDETVIQIADVRGNINEALLNELLKEVIKHECECRKKWREHFGC